MARLNKKKTVDNFNFFFLNECKMNANFKFCSEFKNNQLYQ